MAPGPPKEPSIPTPGRGPRRRAACPRFPGTARAPIARPFRPLCPGRRPAGRSPKPRAPGRPLPDAGTTCPGQGAGRCAAGPRPARRRVRRPCRPTTDHFTWPTTSPPVGPARPARQPGPARSECGRRSNVTTPASHRAGASRAGLPAGPSVSGSRNRCARRSRVCHRPARPLVSLCRCREADVLQPELAACERPAALVGDGDKP